MHRQRLELLANEKLARRREKVLLLGPSGVGTTHLALPLGDTAMTNGFSVASMTADELLDQFRRDDVAGLRRMQRRRDSAAVVWVTAKLGFQALDRRDAHFLCKALSSRDQRASIITISNTSIREGPEMIAGGEMVAAVILDRLLHHCHLVQIDGRSFRLRDVQIKRSES